MIVLRMLGRLPQRNLKRKRILLFTAFNWSCEKFQAMTIKSQILWSHEDSPLSSGVWQWSATKTFGVFLMKLPNLWKIRKKITGSTKCQLLLVKWHWAMKPRSHRVLSQRCRSSFKNPSRMVCSQGKLQKLPNVPQGGGDPWRQLRIESIEESHLARH